MTTYAHRSLEEEEARRDRLQLELDDLNRRLNERPGDAGLENRVDNTMRAISACDKSIQEKQERRAWLRERVESGEAQLEDGADPGRSLRDVAPRDYDAQVRRIGAFDEA
jgi:hypothetical protein